MIISNSHRYIFIHIHKTAGNSVTNALAKSLNWNDIFCSGSKHSNVVESYYQTHFGLGMHCHAKKIRDVVGPDVWEEYFSFAFVRNPYYRIVSLYTWLSQNHKAHLRKQFIPFIERDKSVFEWPGMKAYIETRSFSEFIRNDQFLSQAPGACPMFDSLSVSGELIVNFVGKVENLAEDFSTLCERLGLGDLKVDRLNVSRKAVDLKEFYKNQQDLDFIYHRYNKDFEAFNYEKLEFQDL